MTFSLFLGLLVSVEKERHTLLQPVRRNNSWSSPWQMIYPAWRSSNAWKGNKNRSSKPGPGPGPREVHKDLPEPRGRGMWVENFLQWGCPKPLPCLWEEKSLLKEIQEAQNISLIQEIRSIAGSGRDSTHLLALEGRPQSSCPQYLTPFSQKVRRTS